MSFNIYMISKVRRMGSCLRHRIYWLKKCTLLQNSNYEFRGLLLASNKRYRTELTQSLSHLQTLTSPSLTPNNPIHQVRIAPEIVDYVDDGRNPDIFTRDFVENVQRGNAVINGKQQAFRDFSQIYANALKQGISGVNNQVDSVMTNAGFEVNGEKSTEERRSNGETTG